jgi:hypothetical protein
VQNFSGEVQNDLRGGAHLPTPPLKFRPWQESLQRWKTHELITHTSLHPTHK